MNLFRIVGVERLDDGSDKFTLRKNGFSENCHISLLRELHPRAFEYFIERLKDGKEFDLESVDLEQ